jgi:predicted peptidase
MKSVLLFVMLAAGAQAQYSPEDMLKACVYTNETGETFAYRMSAPQFPVPGKKYPLILVLHGSGECGTDNLKQVKVGVPALMGTLLRRPAAEPVIVVAPQCQGSNWWVKRLAMQETYAASPEPTPSLGVALDLCRHLVAERQADPDRLYITGLSLGGFGTWDAIQREPSLFAAALPICGGGDIRRVQGIRRMPIWVFHGRDDKNVPVDCSRRMVTALKQLGSRAVRYTEYEGAEHNVWDRTYDNAEVVEWLLRQRRSGRPWWQFWK